MATPFHVTPTTDIHLVAGISTMNSFPLEIIFFNLVKVDMAKLSFEDFAPNVATIVKNVTEETCVITAVSAGHTIGRIKYTDNGVVQECFVSIWVHPGVAKFWAGSNQVTINTGASYPGYVVSVFAKFDDGEIGDITYHPYLNYVIDDPNICFVSDHIIKSSAAVSDTPLETNINISIDGVSLDPVIVEVAVKAAYDEERRILEKDFKGISSAEHLNLLIIGDGFSSKDDFDIYKQSLIDDLTTNSLFSPFHLIKDKMTIWSAFEATNDVKEGISISNGVNTINNYFPDFEESEPNYLNDLIKLVGMPNSSSPQSFNDAFDIWKNIPGFESGRFNEDVFNSWLNKNTVKGYIETKDSVLGISIGDRLGDKIKSHVVGPTPRSVNEWYRPTATQRGMSFDRRRYPQSKHLNSQAFYSKLSTDMSTILESGPMDTYFGSLKFVDTQLSEPEDGPDFHKGNTWQTTGKDRQMVVVICNHYKWAGSSLYVFHSRIEPEKKSVFFGAVCGTLNSEQIYTITSNIEIPERLIDTVDAQSNFPKMNNITINGLFAHELAHAFGLEDEYEGAKSQTSILNESDKDYVNLGSNVTTLDQVIKDGTDPNDKKIDPEKIKWNFKRAALSSIIVDDATATGSNIIVKVEESEIAKWKNIKEYKDPITDEPITLPLYLRSGIYDPNFSEHFHELAIDEIVNIDSNLNLITLKVNSSDLPIDPIKLSRLKMGSGIYLPKRIKDDFVKSNDELSLINPRVIEYLAATNTPFGINEMCSEGNNDPEFPPSDFEINDAKPNSEYPDFSSPRNRFLVSGIYEGGAVWNCNVFRGNGWSILRGSWIDANVIRVDGSSSGLDPTEKSSDSLTPIPVYARFDLVAKYYLVSLVFPTNLEKLDRLEYRQTDSSEL